VPWPIGQGTILHRNFIGFPGLMQNLGDLPICPRGAIHGTTSATSAM
jgi:hypothetical protein